MKYKAWYVVFLIIILAPIILSVFLNDIEEQGENRTLSEKPDFAISEIGEFPEKWEMYFNDHAPFRNFIIGANSAVMYYGLKDSPNDDIIIGNEDWLFLKKDEIDSYKKINVYNERALKAAADYFNIVSEYCKNNGAKFIIFIAPDKAEIYSDKVPDYVVKLGKEKNRAELFAEYINENTDVTVVYPKDEMLNIKDKLDKDLYYQYDAHWNQIGAYIGTRALVKEMDVNLPEVMNLSITEDDRINYSLAGMLGIRNIASKEKDYVIDGYNDLREPVIEYVDGDGNNVFTSSDTPLCKKRVLMLRDSFFTAMEPYIATCFESIHAPHYTLFYSPDMIEEETPDYVVFEVVERALDVFTYFELMPPSELGTSPWDIFYPEVDSVIYEDFGLG